MPCKAEIRLFMMFVVFVPFIFCAIAQTNSFT